MEEDLSNVNLCALHMEMRNTEQLVGSLGLFAHKCGSLKELNAELSSLGPENFKHDYVKIKEKKNQGTAINRQNIKVSSMSGEHLCNVIARGRYSVNFWVGVCL